MKMPEWLMKSIYKIVWSGESFRNLKGINEYLEYRWTQSEVKKFTELLEKHLNMLSTDPFLLAKSERSNGARKSVLSGQTAIY